MGQIKFEIDKKKFANIINAQMYNTTKCNMNILDGICISVKDSVIRFVSTDGNKLLATNLNDAIKEKDGKFRECVLRTDLLSKLKFIKYPNAKLTGFDFLQITIDDKKGAIIEDVGNKITYNIGLIEGQYPKWEQFLYRNDGKRGYTTVGFNRQYLIRLLSGLITNPRTEVIEMSFRNNKNLSSVYFKSDYDDLATQAILMPVQVRR